MLTKTVFPLLGTILLLIATPADAGVIGNLSLTSNIGSVVTLDVRMKFDEPGDLAGFGVELEASGATTNGLFSPFSIATDFDPFGFLAETNFASWDSSRAVSLFTLDAPLNTPLTFLANEEILLGTITFDYSALSADSFTISIAGSTAIYEPSFGIGGPQDVALSFEGTDSNDAITVDILSSAPSTVPEPTSVAIWGLLGVAAFGLRRRKK